jgi:molybdate transport system permease protein
VNAPPGRAATADRDAPEAPTTPATGARGNRWDRALARALTLAGLVLASALALFLVLPLVALALREPPGRVFAALGGPEAVPALLLSLETTLASLAITLLGGIPLAYLLARRAFPGRAVVETLLTLPTVLPPAVAGVALLVLFGRRGALGQVLAERLGVSLPFTTVAVVMAQVFVSAPFFLNAARSAIAQLDHSYEDAAALDGAAPAQTLLRVVLPLVSPALYTGAALAWARALGEFGATIVFAGSFLGRTETAPLAIYFAAESDFETAIALSVVLLVASYALLLAVRLLRPFGEPA